MWQCWTVGVSYQPLHLHKVRLLNGCLVISPADIRVLKDVAWKFLVDLGCLALHSLLWVQDEGQLLVLHLQRPDALGRSTSSSAITTATSSP